MKLNHINLPVTDIDGAEHFLKTYFGLRNSKAQRFALHTEWADEQDRWIVVLFDDDNLVLTLFKAGQVEYPSIFHIGFMQESEAQVDEIYRQLKDDGFDVKPPERHHAWTFYVRAPGGFMVEVLA